MAVERDDVDDSGGSTGACGGGGIGGNDGGILARGGGIGDGTWSCGRGDTWSCSSGDTWSCGNSDDGGGSSRSSSLIFREQPLEREFTPFFLQMTTRVCGGSLPLL